MKRASDRGSVLGLLIPANEGSSVEVVRVELTAVALSGLIGGGLLDEGLHGVIDGSGPWSGSRSGFTFYVDEERATKRLPTNDRAAVLSARLGRVERGWLAELRGDALVLGLNDRFDDVDVPQAVVEAAVRSGLLTRANGTDRR